MCLWGSATTYSHAEASAACVLAFVTERYTSKIYHLQWRSENPVQVTNQEGQKGRHHHTPTAPHMVVSPASSVSSTAPMEETEGVERGMDRKMVRG